MPGRSNLRDGSRAVSLSTKSGEKIVQALLKNIEEENQPDKSAGKIVPPETTCAAAGRWRPMSMNSKVFYYLEDLVNANSACVLIIKGAVCYELLQKAAQELGRVHPLLRSIIANRLGRLGWTETEQVAEVIELTVPDSPLSQQLEDIVNNAWLPVFDMRRDIPFRVYLFRCGEYSILQLITSHVAEDARASYQISYDLARIYAAFEQGKPSPVPRITPPTDNIDACLFPASSWMKWIVPVLQASYAVMRDILIKDISLPVLSKPPYHGKHLNFRRGFLIQDVDAALFQKLRRVAKERNATVHSLLLLAVCKIIRRRNADYKKTIRLIDMFSLRSQGEGALDDLYEIAAIPYQLRVAPGSDEYCLQQIKKRIDGLKKGDYLVEYVRYRLNLGILALSCSIKLKHALVRRAVQARILASNPGQIPFALNRFGSLPVEEFFTYPQLFPPGAVMCQFSGYLDRVRLIVIHDHAALGVDGGKAFMQELLAELDAL